MDDWYKFLNYIKNNVSIMLLFLALIYFLLLINKIVYETKIYRLDLSNLEQKKRMRVAGVTAQAYQNGTMRYANQIARGTIQAEEQSWDEKILRRKLQYKHDMINSIVTAVTQSLKR